MTNHHGTLRAVALAAAMLAGAAGAQAQEAAKSQYDIAADAAKKAVDALGIQLWGYMRGGAYYARNGLNTGKYGVGELGYNRLGNEGDQYIEFGIGKKWDLGQAKAGIYWMPYLWSGGDRNDRTTNTGTKQFYADVTGLSFAPTLTFWGGQRYHRIQDLHIIDNWLMEDGDNYGGGVDGIPMGGFGTLNVAVYTDDATESHPTTNGKRLNLQWRKMPITDGGTLDLTAGWVRGSYADKKNGFALGALYNQKFMGDFTNSLFIQASNGHADLRGKFYNTSVPSTTVNTIVNCVPGVTTAAGATCPASGLVIEPTTTLGVQGSAAKQFRILDSVTWQSGPLGGQAFIGYQTLKPNDTDKTTKNLAAGGRVSYGIAPNVKLYFDANVANLKTDGQSTLRIDKETIAVAVAPKVEYWSRPEVRLYLTRVGGNGAYKAAAFNGRSSATLAGIQVEAWWE